MPNLTRRGFTLVELLIALLLMGIVTAAFYGSLTTNQRAYQKQTQVIDLQQNMRAATAILPQELREIDASEHDISAMSATSITFRAHRWMGFICTAPVMPFATNPAATSMILRRDPFYGRFPINTATDVMFVRYEGDDGTRKDDTWAQAQPTLVASAACPDTKPGLLVTMNLNLGGSPNISGGITNGSPVLGYETVTYGLYDPSGGADTTRYIGLTTANGTQPLIGPLLPNGLSLSYYDSTGAVTANKDSVARVDIVVRALTNQRVRSTTGASTLARVVDSVRTSVALRNNRRF
jgi:prepilin-type N-terminal cleavage/methylation domain-containing protein